MVDDPVQTPVGGSGRGGVAGQPDRLHGRRRAQEGVARLEGRRRLGQGPVGGPHGRPPRRRRLLVRVGARRVHHEHVLHGQPAAVARGLEPRALPGPLRRPVVDAAPARRGGLPRNTPARTPSRASGTTRTRPSPTPSADSRPRRRFYDDFRRTPFADEMTLDAALQAMEAHDLGTDDATDILAVSFSATDSIGHTYGSGSQEAMDQILRLDQTAGTPLRGSRAPGGPGPHAGGAERRSRLDAPRGDAAGARDRRPAVSLRSCWWRPCTKALADRFGHADGIVAQARHAQLLPRPRPHPRARPPPRPTWRRRSRRRCWPPASCRRCTRTRGCSATPSDEEPFVKLFRNSFFQPRSPHIMTLLKENVYLSTYAGGTGHGTAHEYDRHVPVVFMGPGIVAGHARRARRPGAHRPDPRRPPRPRLPAAGRRPPAVGSRHARGVALMQPSARRRHRRGRHRADDAPAHAGRAAGPVHHRRPRRRQREDAAGGGRSVQRGHAGPGLPRARSGATISTPSSSSPPAATATPCWTWSRSDKHLFVEKPVAYSLKETEEVAAAARGRRGQLMVGYHKRFDPAYLRARDAVRAMKRPALRRGHRPPSRRLRRADAPRGPAHPGEAVVAAAGSGHRRRPRRERGHGRRRGLRRPHGGEAGPRRPTAWPRTSSSTASSTT